MEIHREAYYTLRRSQVDQVSIEKAGEELAARLAMEREGWEFEREALLARQSQLQKLAVGKEQIGAEKERVAKEKEKEMGEIVGRM